MNKGCSAALLALIAGAAASLVSAPALAQTSISKALAKPVPATATPPSVNADAEALPMPSPLATPEPLGPPAAVDAAAIARLMGSPVALGLRGDCPELVDLNGGVDGDLPFDVAFLPNGSTAVIVNTDSDNVTYFDIATLTFTGATAVGDFPSHVAVTPNGQYILTANVLSNDVSVIDAATRTVVATIPVTGTQPYRIAITSDSTKAVVGVINNATDATFSVLDLTTMSEIRSFPGGTQGVYGGFGNSVFPIFGNTFGTFALAPDNQTIVLPASGVPSGSSTVFFFDLNTGAQTNAIVGPAGARAVSISNDGALAAVAYIGNSQRIDIFDMATQTLANTIPTAQLDAWVRFSPDASKLVTGYLNDTFIIDRATGGELFRTQTGTIGDIEITHDGNYVVVPNNTTRVISLNAPHSVLAAMTVAPTADMAVSPTAHVAVALNNRFGEDLHAYSTNGASSAFLAAMPAGPAPEGDAPFDVDISADGQTAVIGMTLSYNVAIVDVPTRTVRAHVTTGKRVMDVAITPNNQYAVSCDGDSDRVSIIDLSTNTVVKQLSTGAGTRPGKVVISADSSTAYVLNIAGTDRIHFVNLAGAASTIVGTALAGQTGSWNGAQYSENSEIRLSPDGSLLAVCDSFNDNLLLIDTATRALVATVPVGDFPIRVAFNPAGTRAYVANVFSGNLSIVNIAGASSSTIATVPIGSNTFTVAVDSDGAYAYATDYNFSTGSRLYVVDTASNSVVSQIPLDGRLVRDNHYDAATDTLFLAANATGAAGSTSALYRVSASGASSSIIDTTPLSGNTLDLAYSPVAGVAIATQPFLDGADFFCFGAPPCPADADGNGFIEPADVATFVNIWFGSLTGGTLAGDFDGNGAVEPADVAAFVSTWFNALTGGGC